MKNGRRPVQNSGRYGNGTAGEVMEEGAVQLTLCCPLGWQLGGLQQVVRTCASWV